MNAEWLKAALKTQLQFEVEQEIERIADEACAQLRKAIYSRADQMALKILDEYCIQDGGRHITIHVKKDLL